MANVREFDGVDDVITLGGSGSALTARSVIVLVRQLATSGDRGVLAPGTGASTELGALYTSGSAAIWYGSTSGDASAAITFNSTDLWLFGYTKASGATPRFHARNLTTGAAASHVAGAGVTADTGGSWTGTRVGNFFGGGGFSNMRIGTGAIFGGVYSDADFDGVTAAKSTASINALSPLRLWDFNQASVATAVVNLLTGSADQSAITGTTVVGDSAFDVWTFGLAVAESAPPNLVMAPYQGAF